MTPVKNKYYMSSNPLLHDLISTPLNIMVENITPGPVRKPVSGVTSCQMNKKEDNIFRRVHHGDTVSADIFPRYTWDRWLSQREDYLLWSLKRFLLSESKNMNNQRAGLAEGGRRWQWADTKTRLAHQNIWISNTVETLWMVLCSFFIRATFDFETQLLVRLWISDWVSKFDSIIQKIIGPA